MTGSVEWVRVRQRTQPRRSGSFVTGIHWHHRPIGVGRQIGPLAGNSSWPRTVHRRYCQGGCRRNISARLLQPRRVEFGPGGLGPGRAGSSRAQRQGVTGFAVSGALARTKPQRHWAYFRIWGATGQTCYVDCGLNRRIHCANQSRRADMATRSESRLIVLFHGNCSCSRFRGGGFVLPVGGDGHLAHGQRIRVHDHVHNRHPAAGHQRRVASIPI